MENDETIRLSILVKGTVQQVGYRHLVQGIARKNHITGAIENLEGYDVSIIAEGTPDDLSRFKEDIQIREYPVCVEGIEVTKEKPTGEFSYFVVIWGAPEEELAERFDSAFAIFSRMEKKQDYSIGLQKETIGLQKETIGLQKETLDEVRDMRKDFDKTITREIAEVRIELREVRSALIQAGIMKANLS